MWWQREIPRGQGHDHGLRGSRREWEAASEIKMSKNAAAGNGNRPLDQNLTVSLPENDFLPTMGQPRMDAN